MRGLLAILVTVAGFALAAPSASALSCAGIGDLAGRESPVLTGRIVDFDENPDVGTGGRILVEVAEIWAQGPVVERVWLRTDLDGWWDMEPDGPVPQGFVSEKTWLFMPHPSSDGLTVNPCNAWPTTEPYGRDLRPAEVSYPPVVTEATAVLDTTPADDGVSTGLVAGIGIGAVLVVLGATLAWRRRND